MWFGAKNSHQWLKTPHSHFSIFAGTLPNEKGFRLIDR
jgi:hypothetical protein